jgi:hypothetical protein
MTRWQRNLLDVLYISMESIPWFVAITFMATISERGFLRELARELRYEASTELFQDPERVISVADALLRQAETATSGPGLWVVALTAFGGFWLMRTLTELRLGGAFGAVALVLASVFGLNILLHLVFAEDLLIWQNQGLANFIDHPQAYVATGADLQAVVDRGGVVIGGATAIGATFLGLIGVWLRFLYAARRPVGFAHVLGSFGIGFAILLVFMLMSSVNDIGQLSIYALPFFMLGLFALAVANGERAALPAEGSARTGSWSVSVTATLVLIAVVASVFGLLAAVDVAAASGYVANLIGTVLGWLLVLILTPIFWVLVPLFEFLVPDGVTDRLGQLQLRDNFIEPADADEEGERASIIPRWLWDAVKVLIFVVLVWLAYRIGRALLSRDDSDSEEAFDEFRTDTGGGGGGLGGLLRGLMRRGSRNEAEGWFGLRAIYGVYGHSVIDVEDRGFERHHSETPLEYSHASDAVMGSVMFGEIAEAFDAARYGGHDADPDQVKRWVADLAAWEQANPQTDEIRDHLEQIRPPLVRRPVDAAEEFARRVKRGREAVKEMRQDELADRVDGLERL